MSPTPIPNRAPKKPILLRVKVFLCITHNDVFTSKATTCWNVVHHHFLVLMWVCNTQQLLIVDYIFIFYILDRIEAVKRQIEIQIQFCRHHFNLQRKKKYSVTTCSCVRIIHYTSGILVKIMHLSSSYTC